MNNVPCKLYIVHCVDTEGPLYEALEESFIRLNDIYGIELEPTKENLLRIQNQEIDFDGKEASVAKAFSKHLINYNDNWEKIDLMLSNIMSHEYRNKFLDSLGNGIIYNWHCLDHVGYESNIRKKEIGYGKIFEHYRQMIKEHDSPDKIYWHFHPTAFSKAAHLSSTSYDNSYEKLHQILSRRVIDNNWFPVVNRAGFHAIRQDSSFFLEQWIPFDYSNQSLLTSSTEKIRRVGYGIWHRAPKEWIPFHPSYEDYQLPGNMNRLTTKCLNIGTRENLLDDKEVEFAFQNAQKYGSAILSFTNHDFRDMSLDIDDIYKRIHAISAKYKNVEIINSDAKHAMQKVMFEDIEVIDNKIELKSKVVLEDGLHKLIVWCENGRVFGSQPYLAIKTISGEYYHDNLYEQKVDLSWEYVFDKSSIEIEVIDKIGIAANDKYGNQSISHPKY